MRIRRTAAVLVWLVASSAARADDAAGARLLREGRAAEAAELFDDPAWKGIALFRSDQLPRAASAFARAGDAASLHNLGNVYVMLGYPALALEAYQRSLALDPAAAATRRNLDLVLEELRRRKGRGGAEEPADAKVLATLDPPSEQRAGSAPPRQPGQDGVRPEPQPQPQPPAKAGTGPDQRPGEGQGGGGGQSRAADAPQGAAPASTSQGQASPDGTPGDTEAAAAGRAEGETRDAAPPRSARQALAESQRATERWLAAIPDPSPALAAKRIAAESARRRARTGPLPEPDDPW